jgi:hypothetical protein
VFDQGIRSLKAPKQSKPPGQLLKATLCEAQAVDTPIKTPLKTYSPFVFPIRTILDAVIQDHQS